ncbi:hypothetical protein [Methylocystis heyeri]|uniref:Porin n=1 Tax=Methylocystis heyeri TaxID=391905 RepID=A0A6B8KII0_9HYPH|nr:hypothetical protein [Methylocystis heyeri]QGM48206.1 hypothetical protein H2LOC_020660 [Methylocystis heyeri]
MHVLEDRLAEKDAKSPRVGKAVAANGKKRQGPTSGPPPEEAALSTPVRAAFEEPSTTDTMFDRARRGLGSTGKPILGLADSPAPGLTIGAYGETRYGRQQNPAAGARWAWQTTAPGVGSFVWQNSAPGGTWQNGFDQSRFVLLPTYAITDNIIFNAEIEFEHAGSAFDNDDKLHGSAEIEQVFIDFKYNKYFNFRSPGIDLVPIGFINQHHEPTQFYSVLRPELYNGLIPSTWKAPAMGAYGRLTDELSYQVQISHSLEDYGDNFANRTDANTVPLFPATYAPGIDGLSALHSSLAPFGDFRQLSNTYAVAGRLDYQPSFIPGLATSVSGYYTPNVTPRGAYGDVDLGLLLGLGAPVGVGAPLGKTSLGMFDAEFRYRMPDTGLELRGEYVRVDIGNPKNLRANNDTDPTNNVGKRMDGYSGEVAYHIPLGAFMPNVGFLSGNWEAVPFYRYTRENLQSGGYAGTDLNIPLGAGQLQYHTVGVAVFPTPQLVLKANYQKVISKEPWGAHGDSVLGGVGFFF